MSTSRRSFDIPKSSPPRFLDQVILPALALEIVLNLG
jgi:hypothetical protein